MQEGNLEKRIEIVRFLRNSAKDNRDRLRYVNHIVKSDESAYSQEDYAAGFFSQYDEKVQNGFCSEAEQTNKSILQKKTTSSTFFQRLVLSSLFLFLIWLIKNDTSNPYITKCRIFLEENIVSDYSDNIFDFIKNIPYTLTYEKTDA